MSDTAFVRVSVEDVNEPPRITGESTITVAENISPSFPIATLIVFDEDSSKLLYEVFPSSTFKISGHGVLSSRTSEVVNYEDASSYSVLVVITDAEGLSAQKTLLIRVLDQNDVIEMRNQIRSIQENSGTGTSIGAPLETWDEDSMQTSRFRVSKRSDTKMFTVEISSGQLHVGKVLLDWESTKTYSINVDAVDCLGLAGPCEDAFSRNNDIISAEVIIQVIDINEPPTISSASVLQLENTPEYGLVGPPLQADDPDTRVEQNLRYSINGPGASVFKVAT